MNISTKKKNNSFTVPNGYFEEFTDNLMTKVNETDQPVSLRIIKKAAPYISIAAAFIFVFTFWFFVINHSQTEQKQVITDIESIINDEMDYYDISENQLYDFVTDTASEENTALEDIPLTAVESDEIIEYLVEQDVSYEAILAEY